jgi:two-component system sensor histidine kinase YesM
MRYRDILDFRIKLDEAVAGNTVLKLILQPLVENALYHGIKNKRQGGTIVVRVQPEGADRVLLEVEDNGIGFAPEKLARVSRELHDSSSEIRLESGYGIGNVNNRIKLYYGREYGVSIASEYQVGTCVSIVIPARSDGAQDEGGSPVGGARHPSSPVPSAQDASRAQPATRA